LQFIAEVFADHFCGISNSFSLYDMWNNSESLPNFWIFLPLLDWC